VLLLEDDCKSVGKDRHCLNVVGYWWQIKQLQQYGLLQADAIESIFRERMSMVRDYLKRRREENQITYRAQVHPPSCCQNLLVGSLTLY